ncbi:stage II sporulation protein D [Anaerotignum sp.]|uniref:stage II sporulation protein D n=1 Tax=Anaerotignum sp. TaxID=2039241 RepID=UPI0028AAC2BB|nr:stage II sporulation protein D [Anaerotignum sp.]
MAKRILAILMGYIILAVVILPLFVTLLWGGFSKEEVKEAKSLVGIEDVFPSELEEYIVGVVSAEMPASFPEEALKAQAVAARTYQVRKMQEVGTDAVLYDVGQAYCSVEDQKKKWGDTYVENANKIRKAVKATEGEIMIYEGEPILAVFHAQSAGKTEASENVWTSPLPYLKSVDSERDKEAPDNQYTYTMSAKDVWNRLGNYGKLNQSADKLTFSNIERSEAGYIQNIDVGGLELTGKEVREALGLRSAYFEVERKGENFVFVTHGYGHGAGMSQYGASFLAQEGKDYREILCHYYQGISFQNIA